MSQRETTHPFARHDPDALSLVLGLLLAATAGLFLLASTTSVSVDGRWVAPTVLLGAGAAGLLASLRREHRHVLPVETGNSSTWPVQEATPWAPDGPAPWFPDPAESRQHPDPPRD